LAIGVLQRRNIPPFYGWLIAWSVPTVAKSAVTD
jgi:hypothetical protein